MTCSLQSEPFFDICNVIKIFLKNMEENEAYKLEKSSVLNKKDILNDAMIMTELGIDLQQHCVSGEKYIAYLKSTFDRANKTVRALHGVAKRTMEQARKLIVISLNNKLEDDSDTRPEFEKLLQIVEKQLIDFDCRDYIDPNCFLDKNRYLEGKVKSDLASSNSVKSVKSDIDEKYPENLSKESLIDLNSVVNLPPVPEDIFTSFSGKPTRSSSLSSLKSMRKVKLFLQRAESSEDEDNSSDNDEHDFSKLVYGDNDENKTAGFHNPVKKLLLGNIKEETQD